MKLGNSEKCLVQPGPLDSFFFPWNLNDLLFFEGLDGQKSYLPWIHEWLDFYLLRCKRPKSSRCEINLDEASFQVVKMFFLNLFGDYPP